MARDGWLGTAESGTSEVGRQLQQLCVACVEDTAVDGAGLAVFAEDGTPETVFATNTLAQRIEDLQFTTGEGPCVDAARSGAPVLTPSLELVSEPRWPALAKELAEAGVGAIFAFPLRIGAVSLGTMDLHRRTPGELSDEQLGMALNTVDRAASVLLAVTAQTLDGPPETTYRMVVHQAAGMAMMQLDTTIEEALLRMRAIAYAEALPINELAADLVSRRRRLSKEEP